MAFFYTKKDQASAHQTHSARVLQHPNKKQYQIRVKLFQRYTGRFTEVLQASAK